MRTIKFRAYLKKEKRYIYQGDRSGYNMICNGDGFSMIDPDNNWLNNDDFVIEQFTGLQDKNGNDIYEGDIVYNENKTIMTSKDDPRTYLVKWQEGVYSEDKRRLKTKPSFVFEKLNPKGKTYMKLIFSKNQIEVTGNIHDKN